MSIILDALRKAEDEKKAQQAPPEIDIKQQILSRDNYAGKASPAPVNKTLLGVVALLITGLAAVGAYSLLAGPKKEKPAEKASNRPVAAPSPTVGKTTPSKVEPNLAPPPPPAPAVVVTPAPPPAKTAPAPATVVVAPPAPEVGAAPAPPQAKTAPVPSAVVAGSPPSENSHERQKENAEQNAKVSEKSPSKAVFGPPDVERQHQIIPTQGASFALEGIIFHADPDKRLAIMHISNGNEATVRIGDSLGTWLVKDIEADKVTFSDQAKSLVLKLE